MPKGSGVFTVTENAVRLTDEEAHDLRREVDAVVESWVRRTRGREPGRRTYVVLTTVQPYPEDTQE